MSAAIAYFWLTQQTIELLTFGLDSHKYFGLGCFVPLSLLRPGDWHTPPLPVSYATVVG